MVAAPSSDATEHRSAVGATLAGIRDLFQRRREIEPLGKDVRLDGQTVLVTGGTSGLGRAVAEQLAERGAKVVATGRTARSLPFFGTDAPVTFAEVDFADLSSVRSLIERFVGAGVRFDRVVQNAGMVAQKGRVTGDGFDEMEQVNVIAPAALFSGLWGANLLRSSPERPRLIVVASEAHRSARPEAPAEVGQPRSYGASGAVAEYGRSKLLLTAFAMTLGRKMAERLDVFTLCPGAVNSNIAREAPGWSQPILKAVFALTFQSPQAAAEPAVYLTCSRAGDHPTGTYLHLLRRKEPAAAAVDPIWGDALWARLYELVEPFGFREPRP